LKKRRATKEVNRRQRCLQCCNAAHTPRTHTHTRGFEHLERKEVGESVGERGGGEGLATDETRVLPRLVRIPEQTEKHTLKTAN
jgi:hypothetical protein